MADKTLELTNIYEAPPVDRQYSDREADIRFRAAELDPALNATEATGQAPGEQIPTATSAPEPPSAIKTGVEAGARASAEGVRNIVDGLRELLHFGPSEGLAKALSLPPGQVAGDRVQAARKILVDGLMQFGFSPVTGAVTGLGQALENQAPEVAGTPIAEGFAAATLRAAMGGGSFKELSPEAQQAALTPLTVREGIETLGPILAPALGAVGKKAGRKVIAAAREQAPNLASERGSLGAPPTPPAAAAPPGKPLNLERIDATAAVKDVMARLDTLVASGEPLRGHREKVTHAETIAEAKRRGVNLERMMKTDPTTFLPDEATQTALRDSHNAVDQILTHLEQTVTTWDAQARADYLAAFAVALKLGELDVAAGTNIARSLESRKIVSEADRASIAKMADLAVKIKSISGVAPEELAAMRAALSKQQVRTWMQSIAASGQFGRDLLHTLWIQSLLTNPVTHTVNLFGTSTGLVWDAVLERPMAELVNRWITRDPEGIAAGETLQAISHPIMAMQDAVRLLGETWRTGQSPFERPTVTTPMVGSIGGSVTTGKGGAPRITAAQYGFAPDTLPGKFVDVTGAVLNSSLMPTGWLRLEDAAPKGIAFRMEIGALSVWQATSEMRKGEAAGTPMTPQQFAARVKELQVHPTPRMIAQAGEHAVQVTMNANLGPTGQLLTRLANTVPFGRWLVPFIRWGGNAFSFAAQRLPVTGEISFALGKNRADFQAGGRLRDQAIARVIVGHAVTAIITYEVLSGNVTGSGAITQQQAALRPYREGPPYSMKVGGVWMPANYLRTLGQVGEYVAAWADFVELSREIPSQVWYDEWAALGTAMAQGYGNAFVNQTAMQGLANLLDEIKDPLGKGGAVARGFARSGVPAGIRQLTRVSDDNIIREVHSITDAFRSGLPWKVEDVPPKRHPIRGEALRMPAGWGWELVSPIFWATPNTDPVDREIITNQVRVSALPQTIGGATNPGDVPRMREPLPGEGVRLTDAERDAWIVHMTQDKVNGQTLHAALADAIRSDKYRQDLSPGPGGGREFLITRTVQAYRKAALGALLEDPRFPTLLPRYEAALRARKEGLLQPPEVAAPPGASSAAAAEGRARFNPSTLLQSLGR